MNRKSQYLYYQGDLGSFKEWINGLDKTSQKYRDIYNSIVWIHPDLGKDNVDIPKDSGWIYAHGSYFSAVSMRETMTVVDGRVYINGVDIYNVDKLYKLLNADDVEARSESDDDLVTFGYLKTSRLFENIN